MTTTAMKATTSASSSFVVKGNTAVKKIKRSECRRQYQCDVARRQQLGRHRATATMRAATARAAMIEDEVALEEAPLTLLRPGGEGDSNEMRAKF